MPQEPKTDGTHIDKVYLAVSPLNNDANGVGVCVGLAEQQHASMHVHCKKGHAFHMSRPVFRQRGILFFYMHKMNTHTHTHTHMHTQTHTHTHTHTRRWRRLQACKEKQQKEWQEGKMRCGLTR